MMNKMRECCYTCKYYDINDRYCELEDEYDIYHDEEDPCENWMNKRGRK